MSIICPISKCQIADVGKNIAIYKSQNWNIQEIIAMIKSTSLKQFIRKIVSTVGGLHHRYEY